MTELYQNIKEWACRLFMVVLLSCTACITYAQSPTDEEPGDPAAITVYTAQNISFGAFSHGASGGSVIISPAGVRTATGTVVPLNLGVMFFQAIFEIDAPEGTIISILNGPDATLSGSNGGSMSLKIGSSSPVSPFITTVTQPQRTPVHIGGTLTVGSSASNPPGTYTGTIYITFNRE